MYLGPGSQRAVLSIHASCGPATAAGGGAGRGCCRSRLRFVRAEARRGPAGVRRGHVRNRARDAASRSGGVGAGGRAATGPRGPRHSYSASHASPRSRINSILHSGSANNSQEKTPRARNALPGTRTAAPSAARPADPRGGDRWNKCAELRRWSPTRLANLHATHVTARHAAP